jgi:hypothetical protein
VTINSKQISNTRDLNSSREKISQQLSKMRLKANLTEEAFNKISHWMNVEITMMESFLESAAEDLREEYAGAIQQLRDQAAVIASRFAKPTSEYQFTQDLTPEQKRSFNQWYERATSDEPRVRTNRTANATGTKLEDPKQTSTHHGKEKTEHHVTFNLPKSGALDELMDEKIKNLSDELHLMQKNMPALADVSRKIAAEIAKFTLSDKGPDALKAMKSGCNGFLAVEAEKFKNVKDPMLTRVFHALVNAVKTLLSYLDWAQSKLTGKTAEQRNPGRAHWISSPVSPANTVYLEAKTRLDKFGTALHDMHIEVEVATIKDVKNTPK